MTDQASKQRYQLIKLELSFFFVSYDSTKNSSIVQSKQKQKDHKCKYSKCSKYIFFFGSFIWYHHIILSIKNKTKIKNKYNIEYPKIDFAFFGLNLFFL